MKGERGKRGKGIMRGGRESKERKRCVRTNA